VVGGELIPLAEQDRSRHDRAEVEAGRSALDRGLALRLAAGAVSAPGGDRVAFRPRRTSTGHEVHGALRTPRSPHRARRSFAPQSRGGSRRGAGRAPNERSSLSTRWISASTATSSPTRGRAAAPSRPATTKPGEAFERAPGGWPRPSPERRFPRSARLVGAVRADLLVREVPPVPRPWANGPLLKAGNLPVAVPGVQRACLDEVEPGVQHDPPGAQRTGGLVHGGQQSRAATGTARPGPDEDPGELDGLGRRGAAKPATGPGLAEVAADQETARWARPGSVARPVPPGRTRSPRA